MSDNTTLNSGSGGDVLRTDDVGGGVKVPYSKILTGGDGVDGGGVSATNPFPVSIVSGSVTAASGSVVGLLVGGQPMNQANPLWAVNPSGSVTGLLQGGQPISSANPLPVSASISVTVGNVTALSGSVMGLLVGGQPMNQANPLYAIHPSGSVSGLLVGGVAVSAANQVPVSGAVGLLVGGQPASITNPASFQIISNGNIVTTVGTPNQLPVNAWEQCGMVISGTVATVLTVQYSFGDFSASGSANQVVPPQGSGKRIRVLSAHVMSANAVNFRWQSTGSAGTLNNISGQFFVQASGGFVLPHNPHGWFQTNTNEGLNLGLSGATDCGVVVTWVLAGQ